jgi:FHA domain
MTSSERCPNCATPREGNDRYCPSCGYDFETGEALLPAHGVQAEPAPPAADTELVVVLSVDEHRAGEAGCPDPPEDRREHIFALDRRSLVIGRADTAGLQIPIHGDPYVSRRHAEIIELGAGWGLRDVGSTNGTKLNGVALEGSEIRVLGLDDVIQLGCFSRLTVRMRSRLDPGLAGGAALRWGAGAGQEEEG